MTKVPSLGRMVHYVLPNADPNEPMRLAWITGVYGDPKDPSLAVDLEVITRSQDVAPNMKLTAVPYDGREYPAAHTWHWPSFVPEKA